MTRPVRVAIVRRVSVPSVVRLVVFAGIASAFFACSGPPVPSPIDGEPVWSPIKDNDLKFAVNTNWDLFEQTPSKAYLLRYNQSWLAAENALGPFKPAGKLPVRQQPPLVYQCDAGDARFVADFHVAKRTLAVAVTSHIQLGPETGQVKQQFTYQVGREAVDDLSGHHVGSLVDL